MTREEAIKVLRTESVEIGGNAVSVARWLTALDAVVKALEEVPDKDVGKNEPLTLDELRQMDGDPVWLVNQNGGRWVIMSGAYLWDSRKNADYGKTWLAYRQKKEV